MSGGVEVISMAVADARLPSSWLNSPKLDRLDDTEFRLYVAGLMYCNLHLADGKILVPALRYLHPDGARRDVADRLCAKKAWAFKDGLEPHWFVVDYLGSQISKAKFEEQVEARRARQKKWRDAHKDDVSPDTSNDASRSESRDGERKRREDKTSLEGDAYVSGFGQDDLRTPEQREQDEAWARVHAVRAVSS
jgi:hypothetical protein